MIIGLTGYAQSGKDTIANILVENYGYTRIAFADKIRSFAYDLNPVLSNGVTLSAIVDTVGWDRAKVENDDVRRLLQDIGISARKVFGSEFWINEAMRSMLKNPNAQLRYVITDVRFKNEANTVKANDGQLWRITRPGVGAVNGHVSESELKDYPVDQVFINDGSLDDLKVLIDTRMRSFV